jgi:hypothetical protein
MGVVVAGVVEVVVEHAVAEEAEKGEEEEEEEEGEEETSTYPERHPAESEGSRRFHPQYFVTRTGVT